MRSAIAAVELAAEERRRAYIHAGHSFLAVVPTEISTILGSCVSVCLFDDVARLGGITHYVLPQPFGALRVEPGKFGSLAVRALFDDLLAAGARGDRVRAKLFGGASMLSLAAGTSRDIGAQNSTIALDILRELRVPVVVKDVGGTRGRKLVFHSDDGAAWVKYVEKC